MLKRTLELGITNHEGAQVLDYAMHANQLPQLATSVFKLDKVVAELTEPYREANLSTSAEPEHDPDIDPEISTIEAALSENPAVQNLVVRSFVDELGDRRLIAYYTPDWEHQITVSEMRRFAKSKLPDDSVPQQFIELDEFEVDSSGVVIRLSLIHISEPTRLR